MSTVAANLRTQALASAKELEQQIITGLKGQIPGPAEAAAIVWATQTLAAAPFLLAHGDASEQVAKAKSVLANVALEHAIDAQVQTAAVVEAAVQKFAGIALAALMAA